MKKLEGYSFIAVSFFDVMAADFRIILEAPTSLFKTVLYISLAIYQNKN